MKKKKRITQNEIVDELVSHIEGFEKRPSIKDIENLNDEYFKMVPKYCLNFIKKYGLMEILGKYRRKTHNVPKPIPDWINERFDFEKDEQFELKMSREARIYHEWLRTMDSWIPTMMVMVEGVLCGRFVINNEFKMVPIPKTDEELVTWKK